MNSPSPFPHDESYDADFVNGEIFNATDDLRKVGRDVPSAPTQLEAAPPPPEMSAFHRLLYDRSELLRSSRLNP